MENKVEINYNNNLKIIFSPDKQELDQEKLLKDIESWKTAHELEKGKSKALQLGIDKLLIEWEVSNFNELNNKIQDKEQRILALRLDRDDLLAKLSEKDNRIAQLDQILKGSALIFQTQQQIIDDLIDKLEVEKSKNTDNTDYQQHLQTDIKRLAGERKELSKRIKELEGEETKNKTVRDQELENLREEIKNLKKRPDITENDWNKLKDELDTLNERIDPSWDKFKKWCEKYVFEKRAVKDEKKHLFPDLKYSDFQFFSFSIPDLPLLDVKRAWSSLIPHDFQFMGFLNERMLMDNKIYYQFGHIFDEWRKTVYLVNR